MAQAGVDPALIKTCIHCGFCLPTCPTYAVLGVEMDSPRGRIYQMQAVAEGRMVISPDFVEHMYCCLGCRACETACPSGVQYGSILEMARDHIDTEATPVAKRLLLKGLIAAVFPIAAALLYLAFTKSSVK